MKDVDLHPSEWVSHPPSANEPKSSAPDSVWAQMRQASRDYEPGPISWQLVLSMTIILSVLAMARHGWFH